MEIPADLVVIGGGLAGMVVANRCAEQGRRVVVIEKGSEPGGESAKLCGATWG